MSKTGLVYLMYHELETDGRSLCSQDPGYTRYAVREADFRRHLQSLAASGIRGISTGEALDDNCDGVGRVGITFDDGCETDYLVAAPILKEAGFGATFYVIAGFLGRSGYLNAEQVRALNEDGFEVGCHSMTHAYLTELDAKRLEEEVVASKDRLEQTSGRRVEHFSCPGGRWNAAISECCRRAGYRSVATSRIGVNHMPGDAFWAPRARQSLLDGAKRLVGNSAYEKLRSA